MMLQKGIKSHEDFLLSLRVSYVEGDYLFVHAGISQSQLRSGDLAVADYPAMLAKLWEAIALLRVVLTRWRLTTAVSVSTVDLLYTIASR